MANKLKNQQGIAMPAVMFLFVLVTLLGFTAMSIADNQTILVNSHQQREQALHYAEAGIHRYMAELNNNRKFYETPASTGMQNTDTTFNDGYYRLVVTSPSISNPVVTIRSTGWHKNSNIRRTVEVELHKKDFVQNLITANNGSDLFAYTRRFIRGDVINGPLHINGDLIVNGHTGEGFSGPIFNGPVTYAGNFDQQAIPSTTPDTTEFNAGPPVKVAPMGMPPTTSTAIMKQKAADDGCLFNGPTCIFINGSTLTIRNQTNGNDTVQNISIPANGVIYVQGNTGNTKWQPGIGNAYVSGVLNGRLTIVAENDIYITANNPTNWNNPGNTPAATGGVTYADLSSAPDITADNIDTIMATCDDMLGLIANRNVRVLHYNWPQDTNPYYWKNGSSHIDVAPTNINIHASVFAVTGSFEYEEHEQGSKKGTLSVLGSICQHKIGPVASFAPNLFDLPPGFDLLNSRISGYSKNYWHDPRLMYDLPPSYLEPTNSGWEIIDWREISTPITTL